MVGHAWVSTLAAHELRAFFFFLRQAPPMRQFIATMSYELHNSTLPDARKLLRAELVGRRWQDRVRGACPGGPAHGPPRGGGKPPRADLGGGGGQDRARGLDTPAGAVGIRRSAADEHSTDDVHDACAQDLRAAVDAVARTGRPIR